jgi:putative DNA primase/helicase
MASRGTERVHRITKGEHVSEDFNDLIRSAGPSAVRRAIESAEPYVPQSPFLYRRMDAVVAKPVEWLWPGMIACGKISIIAGNPGLGKSQITAAIAAIVSTGGQWPVTGEKCLPGGVIIISAEDDAADTIRPRLEAVGADLSRCCILDAVHEQKTDGEERIRALNIQSDIGRLGLHLKGHAARLIILDPISAYLGGIDSHKNTDVRAALAPLSKLAEEHGIAVVAVTHMNKSSGSGEALMRFTGSLAFVAAARAAFVVTKDGDDGDRRLMLPAKNNLAKDTLGLGFNLQGVSLPSGIETSRVMWEPDPVAMTADEALARQPDEEERDAFDEALELLRQLLKDGPVGAAQIKEDAAQLNIGDKVLRRARKRLNVQTRREGFGRNGAWIWSLPASKAS